MSELRREISKLVEEAVVYIQDPRTEGKHGTGFFILSNTIVTCRHVIDPLPFEHFIITDYRGYNLRILQILAAPQDDALDLAILVVDADSAAVLPLGIPEGFLGEVFAFGFQFVDRNYHGYPVHGMMAGCTRERTDRGEEPLYLIDRGVISGGLSGAPLFSLDEESVIGVVKRSRPEGGGYAIPIEQLNRLRPSLLKDNVNNFTVPFVDKYVKLVCREHEFITMIDAVRSIRLDEIYVSITLSTHARAERNLFVGVAGQLLEKRASGRFLGRSNYRDLGSPARLNAEREASVIEVLGDRKSIILGDPGSGKTTFLRHLVSRISQGKLSPGRVPIFIKLTDIKDGIGAISRYLEGAYPEVARHLVRIIRRGGTVLLLDGFDEVPLEYRDKVIREVERVAALGNQVVLSCRVAAFPRGVFPSDYRIFECIGFTPLQQKKFLKQWFRHSPERSTQLDKQLRRHRGTAGFARNPLLLSLIATVTENDPDFRLPTQRIDLYARAIELMLNRGHNRSAHQVSMRQKRKLLKALAAKLFCEGREHFDEEYFCSAFDMFSTEGIIERTSIGSSDATLHSLVEEDGIIDRLATNAYRFIHLTFQEYLFATWLFENDRIWDIVPDHILDPRWEEIIRLLCGLMSGEAVDKLLKYIWEPSSIVSGTNSTFSLLLALRCVGDVQDIPDDYFNVLLTSGVDTLLSCELPSQRRDILEALACACARSERGLEQVLGVFANFSDAQHGGAAPLGHQIELLGLTATTAAARQLEHMFHNFSEYLESEIGESEDYLLIFGELISAVGKAGLGELWEPLAGLLRHHRSCLAATTAMALADLREEKAIDTLLQTLSSPSTNARPLAASALLAYQEESIATRVIITSFVEVDDYFCQCVVKSNRELNSVSLSADLTRRILDECRSVYGRANAFGVLPLFLDGTLKQVLRKTFSSENESTIVRCAALQTFVRIYLEETGEVLAFALASSTRIELTRSLLLAAAGAVSDNLLASIRDEHSLWKEKALRSSLLEFLIRSPQMSLQSRLVALWEADDLSDSERILSLAAIAKIDEQRALEYIRVELKRNLGVNRRVGIYKILGEIGGGLSCKILETYLPLETDVTVIGRMIDAISRTGSAESQSILLSLLEPSQWPKSWPPARGPLKRAEQKPSDGRRLVSILGLDRLVATAAIPHLSDLANDVTEPWDIRDAASSAMHNICWTAGITLNVANARGS